MSKLQQLIDELCPDGVEFKELGSICKYTNGKGHEANITGSGKYIVVNSKFVSTEGTIVKYSNVALLPVYNDDVLIVLSDLPNGKALAKCFIVEEDDKYTLNQRIASLRITEESIKPRFLFYYLDRNVQLTRYNNGVDQTNLKKSQVLKIKIPIPPLEVQNEIVRILDKFTELTAELTAELEARKKQYEYYRDKMFNCSNKTTYQTLGELGEFIRGNGLQKKDLLDRGYNCIHYGQIYTHYNLSVNTTKSFVNEEMYNKLKKAWTGDLIIASTSENDEDLCKSIVWLGDEHVAISGDAYIYKHSLDPRYVNYFFNSTHFQNQKKRYITGIKVKRVSGANMKKIVIPVPVLEKQVLISDKLDTMYSLITDISRGLPAEIEGRKKQYEFYRNKLLSFNKL